MSTNLDRNRTIRFKIGEVVSLNSNTSVTLLRHSHKMVDEGVQSPLGVELNVFEKGQESIVFAWIDLENDSLFSISGVEMKLVDFQYQKWMDISIP